LNFNKDFSLISKKNKPGFSRFFPDVSFTNDDDFITGKDETIVNLRLQKIISTGKTVSPAFSDEYQNQPAPDILKSFTRLHFNRIPICQLSKKRKILVTGITARIFVKIR